METNHKPLVPLLGTKHLDSLAPRILRFHLHLARFDYSIVHVPGKPLYTAVTLSRAPLSSQESDARLQEEAEAVMEAYVAHLPASSERVHKYRLAHANDLICSFVIACCQRDGQKIA